MKEIKELWEEFQSKPFPKDIAGLEIDGVDLVSIDTFAAGCISTFIENKGTLDNHRHTVLRECMSDLEKVKDKISEEGKESFLLLHKLGTMILQKLE